MTNNLNWTAELGYLGTHDAPTREALLKHLAEWYDGHVIVTKLECTNLDTDEYWLESEFEFQKELNEMIDAENENARGQSEHQRQETFYV